MNLPNNLYQIAESYNQNSAVRTLLRLIPWGTGDASDNFLSSFYTKERERRLIDFLTEVNKGNLIITDTDLASDDYLHKFYITLRAILETKRTEKIVFFARLFLNSKSAELNKETDSYEDFIKILDDLSYQEVIILRNIYEFEKNNLRPQSPYRGMDFYRILIPKLQSAFGITENEAESLIARLNRTGLIMYNKGSAHAQRVHDYVIITDLFNKLNKFIQLIIK